MAGRARAFWCTLLLASKCLRNSSVENGIESNKFQIRPASRAVVMIGAPLQEALVAKLVHAPAASSFADRLLTDRTVRSRHYMMRLLRVGLGRKPISATLRGDR